MVSSKWISIDRCEEYSPCIYYTKTGEIIFRIIDGYPVVLDEYRPYEKYLLDVCLNWDDTKSYDFDVYIKSLIREEKLKSIGI